MVKRLTVSMPDDFYDRIDRHRERINISEIFRAAMDQELTAYERLETKIQEVDMDSIIERLRKEKEEECREAETAGHEFGVELAKVMRHRDLKKVAAMTLDDDDAMSILSEIVNFYNMEEEFNQHATTEEDHRGQLWFDDNGSNFVAGALEAVSEFWDQVQDKL